MTDHNDKDTCLSPIRCKLVALAESYIGCGEGKDHERYLDLVCGPHDLDPQMRNALDHASGCALVARGLWRKAGLVHPLLQDRYRIRHAMADIEQIARDYGAWVPGKDTGGKLPKPGDAVVLDSPTGGHAFTVLAVHIGEKLELESVDGGQLDAQGHQLILRMHRYWSTSGRVLVDHAYRSRPVRGWVDVDKLQWPTT